MLSLLRSGEAFPFFGDADRERERERDLLSADAERSLQNRFLENILIYIKYLGPPNTVCASQQNQRKHEKKTYVT